MAGALTALQGEVTLVSGLLYRVRGTSAVWKLYYDYEPAPGGTVFTTPPLEFALSHGDEVAHTHSPSRAHSHAHSPSVTCTVYDQ